MVKTRGQKRNAPPVPPKKRAKKEPDDENKDVVIVDSQPASDSAIGVTRSAFNTYSEGDISCAICFEDVKVRGRLNTCKHMFCHDCIIKWSENSNTCPLCKQRFEIITKQSLDPAIVIDKADRIVTVQNKSLRNDINTEEFVTPFHNPHLRMLILSHFFRSGRFGHLPEGLFDLPILPMSSEEDMTSEPESADMIDISDSFHVTNHTPSESSEESNNPDHTIEEIIL